MTTPEGRDRIKDLQAVADHLLRGLFTWTMPADWGADYGYVGDGRQERRGYTSAEEILAELGFSSENLFHCPKCNKDLTEEEVYEAEDHDGEYGHTGCWQKVEEKDWPPEDLRTYAEGLWKDVGAFLRARGALPPPPPPPRPPWADMRSKDGALELTIPDELIPFVGTDTTELASNEIAGLTGMVAAYDGGRFSDNFLSAGFVRSQFEIRMALWRTRRQVALLQGKL